MKSLKFRFFRYFTIISPWKGRGPSFEQTLIPFSQGCFETSLVEIGLAVIEKNIFTLRQYIFAISFLSHIGRGRGPLFEQT